MQKKPALFFDAASYMIQTAALNTEQHGALLLLRMHIALTGSLPENPSERARIARLATRRFKEYVWPAIRPVFEQLEPTVAPTQTAA